MEINWNEDNATYLDSEPFSNIIPAAAAANNSNSTTWAPARGIHGPNDPWVVLMRFICDVWLTLPIAVAGIVGNLVCIFVLRQYRPAMTTTLILQCLAWTDTLYLTLTVVLRLFRYVIPNYDSYSRFIFAYLNPIVYAVRLTGTWLTVLLTVDRFIAVCYPLHASRLCSRAKTILFIVIIVLCSSVFNAPRFFEYIVIVQSNQTLTPAQALDLSLLKNPLYTFIYRLSLFFIAMYLVPMTTVTILNTKLLITFRRSAKHRATSLCVNSFTSTHSSSSDRSTFSTKASCTSSVSSASSCSAAASSACSMTRMVTAVSVTVVLISLATDSVAMLTHSVWSVEQIFPGLSGVAQCYRYLSNFTNVLVTLRCAVNFVVYCAVSRQFRVVFYRSFCVCRARHPTMTTAANKGGVRHVQAAPTVGRQSSSNKISTGILSLMTGQRKKGTSSSSPGSSAAFDVVAMGGEGNGCIGRSNPLNHALISYVKR